MNALARPGVLLGLLAVQLGIIAPHWSELPAWIFGLFIACGSYRYAVLRLGWPQPGGWLKVLLLALVLGALGLQFRRLAGLDVAASFLILMQAMKLLEAKDQRDAMILMQLGYFLIATSFLFSQSLWMGIYLVLGVWLSTSILIGAQSSQGLTRLWPSFKLSGLLVLQALPLMALLFVLFPRIPGPIWQMQDPSQAKTGLSDSMTPEDISELSQSPEIAFRVESTQGSQDLRNRYWRVLTYGRFDGRRWQPLDLKDNQPALKTQGKSLSYQITQEPSQQPWLIALDLPASLPAGLNAQWQHDATLRLSGSERVSNRLLYQLDSYPDAQLTRLSDTEHKLYTRLPNFGDKRSRAWAAELRQQHVEDADFVKALMDHIHQQPFYYDLQVEPLETNTIDGFWFSRQRGFCAHYAGAVSFMLRSVGIPARIVAGYSGGDYNPQGQYLIVRQLHAHAWVEVWLGQHWQRIDPTTAIAPQRVMADLASLQQQRTQPSLQDSGHELGWLSRSELWMDSLNYRWQRWILSYDLDRQRELLEKLGLANWSWQQLLPLVAGLIIGVLLLLTWWLLPKTRRLSALQQSFTQLQQRLMRLDPGLGPIAQPADWLLQAARLDPGQKLHWQQLHADYLRLRYQPQAPARLEADWLRRFKQQIAKLKRA